jgi:WD40 repeat protein
MYWLAPSTAGLRQFQTLFYFWSAVRSNLTDTHDQIFLRGHSDTVMVLQMSPSVCCHPPAATAARFHPRSFHLQGKLLASGQAGADSDVLVWDAEDSSLLFRLEEHDHGAYCIVQPAMRLAVNACRLPLFTPNMPWLQVLWTLHSLMMSDCSSL